MWKKIIRTRLVVLVYTRLYGRLLDWYVSLSDKKYKGTGLKYLPPASLRSRVNGTPHIQKYLDVGKRNAQEIKAALNKVGKDLNSFQNILDFGCGCGRTVIWFSSGEKNKFNIYGTDIDVDAVKWCRENLEFGKFSFNKGLPPLEFADNYFDFIYAISVFTHLNEQYQFLWLKELKRVLKPGGLLIITLHGTSTWEKDLLAEEITKLKKTGIYYIITDAQSNIYPHWYQVAYHTKEYVLDKIGQHFKVLDYIEKGINNHQDLVILQKN